MSKNIEDFGGTSINGKTNIGKVLKVKLEVEKAWRIYASVFGLIPTNGIFIIAP